MKRLGLLLLLLLIAPASADDFRDARTAFETAFRLDKPSTERYDAVYGLSVFDNRDAMKLLLSGVELTQRLLDPLHVRKAEVDEELERILGPQMLKDTRKLPTETHARVRVLKRESSSLMDEIDGELKVFEAIEDCLATMRDPKVIEHLSRNTLSEAKHWRSRRIAAVALGEVANPGTVKYLVRALRDKDDRVKVSVALSLGKMKAPEALKGLAALLEDSNWTVRSAAIEALGDLGEKSAVRLLIDRMEKEKGRLQNDCAIALSKLTGQKFGATPGAWRRWWEENKDKYGGDGGEEVGGHPAPRAGGKDAGYYGIPIETHRAIFILDVSGSMSKPAKAGGMVKIESAKAELIRALKSFPSSGRMNLVIFNDVVKKWKDRMVPSNQAMKGEAANWIKDLSAASSTNIYDALDTAFRVAGLGARDKNYELGADTIFLLSDGSPTKPDGSLDDWEKIIRASREWNRLKRIKVHTIGIGGHNVAFMSRLAAENGGTYVAR